jgi:hypothetical protein
MSLFNTIPELNDLNIYDRKAVTSKHGLLLELHLPFTPLTVGILLLLTYIEM